jgi:DNA modification methylase
MKKSPEKKQRSSAKAIGSGDVFRVGDHVIACGDCRDKTLVEKAVDTAKSKIALVVADVPYGVAVAQSKRGFHTLAKDRDIAGDELQSDREYRKFTADWIEALKPSLARKNTFYIFNADRMLFALREGMLDAGCRFAQLLIWLKSQAVLGRLDYLPQHELVAYGWVGAHEFKKAQDRSLLFYPKPQKNSLHPTMKPVGLIRRLILNSSNIGDVVVDPFLGSGTTAVAAHQTGRRCVGIEIDPEYCATAISRLEKLTGQQAKRI